jgi:regulator of nucleoside diphosphate kinase
MFSRKTMITRPDRDRLERTTQSNANLLRWGLFIDELVREIDRARVIDAARVPPDVVTMHSTLRIRDLSRDTSEEYTLVYPEDAALRRGKLSVFTPVGTALLGRRVGDVVRLETADGLRSIVVEAVLYQPEAAARRHPGDSSPSMSGDVELQRSGNRGRTFTPKEVQHMRNYIDLYRASTPIPESMLRPAIRLHRVPPEQERSAHAARLARTRVALRRARRGELVLVYILAALVSVAMLPAVIAATAAWGAVALWRHLRTRWRGCSRRRAPRVADVRHAARLATRIVGSAVRRAFQPRSRLGHPYPSGTTRGAVPFGNAEHDEKFDRERLGLVRPFRATGRHHVRNTHHRRSRPHRRARRQCSTTGPGGRVAN